MRRLTLAPLAFGLLLAIGCSQMDQQSASAPMADMAAGVAGEAAAVRGQANREGSFLAYEHYVSVRTEGEGIGARIAAVREACSSQRFGQCSVLGENQTAGEYPSGRIELRAAPAAIEPLVALGSEGAEIGQRSTSAEDLADAVMDNRLTQARLRLQHEKLTELLDRRDLEAEAIIALTRQMAEIEAQLQTATQQAAQQQRRLETNKLTLEFHSSGFQAQSSAVRQAFSDLGSILDRSTAALIVIAGGLLPFLLVGYGLWRLIAWRWRRRNAKATPAAG
jgi:hypothetical protein